MWIRGETLVPRHSSPGTLSDRPHGQSQDTNIQTNIDSLFQQFSHFLGIVLDLGKQFRRFLHNIESLDGSYSQHWGHRGRETVAEARESLVINDIGLPRTESPNSSHSHVKTHTDNVHIICLYERVCMSVQVCVSLSHKHTHS